MKKSLMWFRYDLRLKDNLALVEAVKADQCYPVYIFDDTATRPAGQASHVWLHHALHSLAKDLNGNLSFFKGSTTDILTELIEPLDNCDKNSE